MKASDYLFQSARLGFRTWTKADIYAMAAINSDENVMEFFPSTQNEYQTEDFIQKMNNTFKTRQFCYFAVELLETLEFIGFIGLFPQNFKAPFTPCVDIGWRLATFAWNKGYATEGAKRCLEYAFEELSLQTIYAIAPEVNLKSIAVMQKIGMQVQGTFLHPALIDDSRLAICVYYKIDAPPPAVRNRLETNPFQYKIIKNDKIIIYRGTQQIMIVKGNGAMDLIQLIHTAEEDAVQLALAKITGHYKH
jgi:RimJ/RimL family protein N-acetyltransferase